MHAIATTGGLHTVLGDLDAAVRTLFERELGKGPTVSFDAPTAAWAETLTGLLPQGAAGTYPGLVSGVVGLCSTAPTTHAAPASNTSQKSWIQFANITVGGCGFLQIDIMDDFSMQLSIIDASDTNGKLMTNTPSTGVTGAATTTIKTLAT